MKQEHESSQESPADRLAGELLDANGSEVEIPAPQSLSTFDKSRLADLLWLNALLEQIYRPEDASGRSRVDRAMQVRWNSDRPMEAEKPFVDHVADRTSQVRRSRIGRRWIVAVTTVALILAGVWFQATAPSRQAQAAVAEICRVAAEPLDREYLVTLTMGGLPPSLVGKVEPRFQATLFVRGGSAFVVNAPSLIQAGGFWFGRDPSGPWLKPSIGPVLSGPGGAVMQALQPDENSPFLQITRVLNKIADRYDVQLLPDDIPARGTLVAVGRCQRIRAQLRRDSNSERLPDDIEVYSDHATGNVVRLVLHWNRELPSRLTQMEFDFVQQSHQPDNWYRPEGHLQRIDK